jgi:hypothetical protein
LIVAGVFYELTALNVVSELGIAGFVGKEGVPVRQLAKEVNVDDDWLRGLRGLSHEAQVPFDVLLNKDSTQNPEPGKTTTVSSVPIHTPSYATTNHVSQGYLVTNFAQAAIFSVGMSHLDLKPSLTIPLSLPSTPSSSLET